MERDKYPASAIHEIVSHGSGRRRYLIQRRFQIKYGLFVLLTSLVGNALTAAGVIWAFRVFHIWQGKSLPLSVFAVVGGLLIVNLMATFLMGVYVSHRVAGPIYNFIRVIKRASQGDSSVRLNLRDDDEFHDVAMSFNDLMARNADRDAETVERVRDALEALKANNIDGVVEALGCVPAVVAFSVSSPVIESEQKNHTEKAAG